jgi:predicted dehydrogenase
MMPLRVAVIGAGPMGRLHARTVAASAARDGDCALVAIADRHAARASRLAAEYGVAAVEELRGLPAADAAIVAVPTAAHLETALRLAEAGLDLLVEKPLALDVGEAMALVEGVAKRGRILQVGHVEWHNPVWRAALARAGRPRRITMQRLQPATERGRDVDVIQDLMLHDLDWVTRAVGEPIETLSAAGRRGERSALDEARVVLRFRSGCVALLWASRVHESRVRSLEIEGSLGSDAVDLLAAPAQGSGGIDPLGIQWRAFVEAVLARRAPENDGRAGVEALRLVERVRGAIIASEGGAGLDDDPLLRG